MYPLILSKVFSEPWCVLIDQHYAIQDALLAHMEGGHVPILANQHASVQVPFTPVAVGLGLKRPTEQGSRLFTKGALGVIPVRGVIGSHMSSLETMCGGYDVAQLTHDLETAREDSSIKRVLVDFHSPGGTVTGVPEAAKVFRALGKEKDTFAFTNGQSASASFWLMSQANHVYMTESAGVGSIGVYLALLDRTEGMKVRGERLQLFKAGKHKAMGLPGNPLTEDDKVLLQAQVDKTYAKFTGAVKGARPGVSSETMQGQMFTGADARDAKLVDSLVSSLGALVSRLS